MKLMFQKTPLILILSFFFSASLASVILAYNNTLTDRQVWAFPKTNNIPGFAATFNSYRFSIENISLSKGFLNLGVWHGHQQLETLYKFPISKVKFKALFDENSALYVYFVDSTRKLTGIRISNTDMFPPIKFTSDYKLKFQNKQSADTTAVNGWREYEILLSDLNTSNLDAKNLSLGFRNEYKSVFIDDVILYDDQNRVVFKEDFFWTIKSYRFILFSTILLTFAFVLILKIFGTSKLFHLLTFTIVISIVQALAAFAISHYFFNSYPRQFANVEPQTLEKNHLWNSSRPDVKNYFKSRSSKLPLKKVDSLVALGSSQTLGEGASGENYTWPNRLVKYIRQNFDENVVFKNFAFPGHTSIKQIEEFNKNLPKPGALVIFSMGNNDINNFEFENNVRTLVKISNQNNYTLLLVFEPNDPQVNSSVLYKNHNSLKTVCNEHKEVSCLDLHSYLMLPELYDSGWMWNDHVHGTDYTYALMADKIIEFLFNK